MVVEGKVVHAEKFTAKSTGKVYTKLFVPVGFDLTSVVVGGDYTALAGVENVPFRLGIRDNQLKLFYAGEEDN